MKNSIILIIIIITFSCSDKLTSGLSGVWNASQLVDYPFDTISMESGIAGGVDKTTIKTDSGVMVVMHIEDSVISIKPSIRTEVLHLYFDDAEKGVFSFYEIDPEDEMKDEDPRWTASNNNFWILKSGSKHFFVIDSHFDQYGNRMLDTLEYKLLSSNKLIIKSDTLTRIK